MTMLKQLWKVFVLTIIGIGLLVCAAAFALSGTWIWKSELLNGVLPKPRTAEIVRLNLYGPAITIVGQTADFHVEVEGSPGIPEWKITSPDGMTMIPRVSKNGMRAEFRSDEHGFYDLYVAVAGESMQIATSHLSFQVIALQSREEIEEQVREKLQPITPVQETVPPVSVAQLQSMLTMPPVAPKLPPKINVRELAETALTHVKTEDFALEAKMVQGSVRSVISRIQTAALPPDFDPAIAIAEQVQISLGNRAKKWEFFILSIGTILDALEYEGKVMPADKISDLIEISNVLLHAK